MESIINGYSKWSKLTENTDNKQDQMKYRLNAYRVLLTRARSRMVICVPTGNPNKTAADFREDGARLQEYYGGTYRYLRSVGIEEI